MIKNGFTLIEILLVVGFITIASASSYLLLKKVSLTNKSTENNRIISMIIASSKGLYANQSRTTGVSNSILINARAVPPAYLVPGDPNTIKDAFGSNMIVTAASFGAGLNNGFNINIQNVPKQICTEMLSKGHSNYDTINVNGIFVKQFGFDMDLPAMTNQCNQLENNDVIIGYMK